jgi:erythromycin esterase-like protein
MYTSSEKVIEYLDEVDPRASEIARQRYGTLSQYEEDPHSVMTPDLPH